MPRPPKTAESVAQKYMLNLWGRSALRKNAEAVYHRHTMWMITNMLFNRLRLVQHYDKLRKRNFLAQQALIRTRYANSKTLLDNKVPTGFWDALCRVKAPAELLAKAPELKALLDRARLESGPVVRSTAARTYHAGVAAEQEKVVDMMAARQSAYRRYCFTRLTERLSRYRKEEGRRGR
eukprot:TRINITY_DN81318_c0_g1_i1.p1 TRINITY_DN81318_c0_g1~~TRINITY_DN81318_c0_g1_i1.p1  ORF type:complete len:179 (-),score=38.64 TRINITY_DN81318_c0_g1_i1:301-837(-)